MMAKRKRKQPGELYAIIRDGELELVVTDAGDAESISELKQELARLIYFEQHKDEYGENQLIEMWQTEGIEYSVSRLTSIEPEKDDAAENSKDEATDEDELDWTEKDYEDEDGEEYSGSELEDSLVKDAEKLIDRLNEQVDEFGVF
ncbi:hypothetical protein DFQ01_1502 [Paenibacillus cellulosilyticus]|uniref:Uncharacterized protein n=1 Tax=Paenibacillus cellulosilyticus TaxID=375489 RepID=A0A2V2YD75_9BACL|nr:hypothetical protein [Paenibacillus cellulosilyticus]PWV88453.1 hypothetical protein DFQ01_1502 [Paenibacillus cellulosilyticus]QKS44089.1 hypothetical protein HUB94_06345 [Paenibacillus cellulosilyticus]